MRLSAKFGLLAMTAALAVPLAQPASAQRFQGGHGGDRRGFDHRGNDAGAVVGGALLGLGVGAAIGALVAPPPVYYAPPPVYYARPAGPPPGYYYAPPPAVYYGY